jgi:predicted permease
MIPFRFSLLDLRLGVRLLVRYPVLTVVGTGSLAVAVAVGAAGFALISLMLWPRMPLPEGERLVAVRHYDEESSGPELRVTADYLRWRGGTGTLTDFAAGRAVRRNLQMGDGVVERIDVAEVTASMFPMARVAPIMGRALTNEDERAAAPPVTVIGERIWRDRYAADPNIIGRLLLLGDTPTTAVGVMPAAFRFPSTFEVWQPLKLDETGPPRAGTSIEIWARLKPGVTRADATSELAVLGAAAAADWPATHAHLRATVESPAVSKLRDPGERAALASVNIALALVVLLVSGNVALLMFARAATRESEILVRSALGATRSRLVAQFFAEALVLSTVAAAIGLALAQLAMSWAVNTFTLAANDGKLLPFWITPTLPPVSIAYGVGLALGAAAVTGILPALKMTRGMSARLREMGAGGGRLKFGGIWTLLIVSQVAVTVAVPGVIFLIKSESWRIEGQQIGVPPEQYLTAKLQRESDMPPVKFEAAVRRVRDAIGATPGVRSATLADKLPLMWNGHYLIEVEEGGAASGGAFGQAYQISTAAVDPDFFAAFDAPPIAGRLLAPGDYSGIPRVVVVNETFVRTVLGGRQAVGRRIRYTLVTNDGQRPPLAVRQPWLEIVGLVRDLGMAVPPAPKTAGAYLPLAIRTVDVVHIAARVSGNMTTVSNALRSIAGRTDPRLTVNEVQALDHVNAYELRTLRDVTRLFGIAGVSALVLALSGIYAAMSFAVSRRTREIGIRVALGSERWRVLVTILHGPLIQVVTGTVLGGILTFMISSVNGVTIRLGFGVVGYALVMFGVCLLASVVPVRRVLAADPIAALKED